MKIARLSIIEMMNFRMNLRSKLNLHVGEKPKREDGYSVVMAQYCALGVPGKSKMTTEHQTTRSIAVPDSLGRHGLSLAADILEDEADTLRAFPLQVESIQMVADWLRKTAATFPEAA